VLKYLQYKPVANTSKHFSSLTNKEFFRFSMVS
jgi:hypothetical protein